MPYRGLLAAHLVAVAMFLSGLFVTAALLPGPVSSGEARRLLRFALAATTPALVLVWAFGIAMAVQGGWYASAWLQAKLVIVLGLSAWHGRQIAALRRAAAGRSFGTKGYGTLPLLAAAVAAIVALVVVKPG